ncbi:MAG: hypothetical protein HYT85_08820 [candidate division NC10 bacterium]|nr:hypothetical protein [candidate division NC10 bacterium]MBI2562104.1 hypothetical protein [candidate division NC10 bacterium]
MTIPFLREGERLVRVHRFRFTGGRGCALGTTDIVVEEELGPVADIATRCQARPDHPTRVPRPHLYVNAETVEGAVAACMEKMRGGTAGDLFFPTM